MSSINGGVQELKVNLKDLINDKNEKLSINNLDLNFIFECLLSENLSDIKDAKKYLDSKGLTFLFEEFEENDISFFANDGKIISLGDKCYGTGEFIKYNSVNKITIKEEMKQLKKSVNFYCNYTKKFWID